MPRWLSLNKWTAEARAAAIETRKQHAKAGESSSKSAESASGDAGRGYGTHYPAKHATSTLKDESKKGREAQADAHGQAKKQHEQAAEAHTKAAKEAESKGNTESANLHRRAAKAHEEASYVHSEAKDELKRGPQGEPAGDDDEPSENTFRPRVNMSLTSEQRKHLVDDLVTNCECWKSSGDREILNSFPDEKLQALYENQQAITVANTAVNGFSDGEREYRVNPESGKWETRLIENKGGDDEPSHQRGRKKGKPVPANADDAEGHDDDDDDDGDDMEANSRTRRRKPQTIEDWLRVAPSEVQNTFKYAKGIEEREKDAIISKLLVNVSEGERAAHRARLQTRSLPDLQNDLALVPVTNQDDANQLPARTPTRGSRRPGARRESTDDDLLGLPVINWQEMGKDKKGQQEVEANSTTSFSASESSDSSDDELEWLQNAPASVRATVENAKALEDHERRVLIEKLIENSDSDENKIRAAFGSKSLKELRQIVTLLPKKNETPPRNYFGAQGAPATTNQVVNTADDMLPLPSMDWMEGK